MRFVTVGELRRFLRRLDPETEVAIATDPKGTRQSYVDWRVSLSTFEAECAPIVETPVSIPQDEESPRASGMRAVVTFYPISY